MRTLMRKGMKNDDLSSIRVHGRCVARMYQHHHFGGKVLVKNRNDSCFTNDYMFPMSQLSQLVVHHADEKPELAQETSKAGSIFRGGSTVALRGGRGSRWCADEGHRVLCNRPWIKGWEKFYTWSGHGRIALRGGRARKWCADEGNRIRCNRPWIKGWEKFAAVRVGSRVALRGGRGNRYCADEPHGVKCNRPWIKGWEKFYAHTLSARRVVHSRRRARRTSFNDQISSIKVYGGRRCYRRCRRCKRRLSCRILWRAKWAYKNQRRCYNRRVIKYRRYLAHHTVRRCKRMYVTRYKWINRYKTKRVCRKFWVTRYRTYCRWVRSFGGKKKLVSKCMRKWRCGVSGLNTPVSIAADGNVQCMSTNGKDCWWGKCRGKSVPRHGKLKPLVCGAMHKKKWGGNGYSSKGHWCNKVKAPVAKICKKKTGGKKKTNPKTGKVCNSKAGAICHGYNLKCFKSSLSQCKKACKADKRCNLAEYKAKTKHCCTSAIATKKQCKGRWAKANGWVGYNICR